MCVAAACSGNGSAAPSTSTASSAPPPPTSTVTSAGPPPATTSLTADQPCIGAAPVTVTHVITIVLENHGFSQVDGQAPYLNSLAGRCGLATDYHAVTHPSLPNYLAMTSGSTQGLDGSDCSPGGGCESSGASIFGQTSWRAYAESMPGNCVGENAGDYAPRHNPAVYYTRVASACAKDDVPLTALPADLAQGALPAYTFITPNLCNDAHSCPLASADAWLRHWVPLLLSSRPYQSGDTALFITFDEDDRGEGNRVYTVVVAPSVPPGTRSSAPFTHYSLLRTQEDLLGLPGLGAAASAASMTGAFHLSR